MSGARFCEREQTKGVPSCLTRPRAVTGHSARALGGIVYAYYQYLHEVRERRQVREREGESERVTRELRAQRRPRRPDLRALSFLIAHVRRAAGLELDL